MMCAQENVVKNKRGGWSIEVTTQVKGLCAIAVVLSHLFPVLQYWGYLSVALFYLFSGYGLFYSLSKNEKYLENFIRKRIWKTLFPFLVVNMLSVLLFSEKNIISLIRNFVFINNYKSGWYILSIVALYGIFYFSAYVTPQMTARKILFSAGVVCYIVCCKMLNLPTYWYNSVIAILLGMLFASNNMNLKSSVKKDKLIVLIVIVIVIAGIVPRKLILELFFSFVLATLVGIYLEAYSFKEMDVLKFLGSISYEIYLIHPVCISFVKIYMTNNMYAVAILVVVLTLVLATGFRKIIKFFEKSHKISGTKL